MEALPDGASIFVDTNILLLPADAISVAFLKHHHLSALATRDDDFDNVDGFEVFKP